MRSLTLPEILDAGYVLLFEEYMRSGKDLVTVWEELTELRGKAEKPDRKPPPPTTARENDLAFQQFQQMMGGVKF